MSPSLSVNLPISVEVLDKEKNHQLEFIHQVTKNK